jgi:hypothetical protein
MTNGHHMDRRETQRRLSQDNDLRITPMMSLGMPWSVISNPIGDHVSVVLMQIMR